MNQSIDITVAPKKPLRGNDPVLSGTIPLNDTEDRPFNCLNCGWTNRPELLLQDCEDRYLGTPFRVDYYRCAQCGLVQLSPIPADISRFYEEYPVHKRKSWLYDWMRKIVMGPAYFNVRFAKPGSVLLDYGCGDGWFLELCKRQNVRPLGFERSPALAAGLHGQLNLPVYSDSRALVHDFESKIDILTMHFVIEHLTDLEQAFADVENLLKPGGLFFLTVPNLNSWEAKLFGKRWHGLDPPRHISFPHRPVIENLARRHKLKVLRRQAVPFPNGFAASISAVVLGHFSFALYLMMLPLGVILSRLPSSGTDAYWVEKAEE